MPEIIFARNLSKKYGSRIAVDHIDLSVNQGEFCGFLGPNGAGKTTTIRMFTGIVHPDNGEVLIGGYPIDQPRQIASLIGVVPEGRGFYDWMTAAEYLYFFADMYQLPKKEKGERISNLFEMVDLAQRKNSRIGSYSRGMKQRLALAKALVHNPKMLFLDEPTLGLDPQGQEDIQRLLKKLNQGGVTIFLSSHLLNEVSDLCSRIIILNNGRIIADGTLDDLRAKTNFKEQSLNDIFLHLTRTV